MCVQSPVEAIARILAWCAFRVGGLSGTRAQAAARARLVRRHQLAEAEDDELSGLLSELGLGAAERLRAKGVSVETSVISGDELRDGQLIHPNMQRGAEPIAEPE